MVHGGPQGESALHLASRAGYLDFVKFLLQAGADVNQKGIFTTIAGNLAI